MIIVTGDKRHVTRDKIFYNNPCHLSLKTMSQKQIQFDILTLFPKMFESVIKTSILGRAQSLGLIKVNLHDLRKWGLSKYRQVDDSPYGGGPGMVLRVDVIDKAINQLKFKVRGPATRATGGQSLKFKVILLTPQGKQFNQKMAQSLSQISNLILICGHYEGFDERIRKLVDLEISIGDYVLTGGEIPAMILVDSISRLVPGVLGKSESLQNESFSSMSHVAKSMLLLEYPHYTRPEDYKGMKVPKILLSGHHAEIEKWRREEAIKRTKKRRPDLLK